MFGCSGRVGICVIRTSHLGSEKSESCQSSTERARDLGYAPNGWQVSGTVFWHSGYRFRCWAHPMQLTATALCRAAVRNLQALYEASTPTVGIATFRALPSRARFNGSSKCICPAVDPAAGTCNAAATPRRIAIRKSWPQRFTRPQLLLERLLRHQVVSAQRDGSISALLGAEEGVTHPALDIRPAFPLSNS